MLILCVLSVLFASPTTSTVTVLYNLSPILPPSSLRQLSVPSPLDITQKCPSLSPSQCCVPIDLSEISLTTARQRYLPTNIHIREFASTVAQDLNVWDRHNCDGPAITSLPLAPARRGGRGSWDAPSDLLISGVSLNLISPPEPKGEEREVRFPSVVMYKGGLYYEYVGGGLVYARVSHWGEGPNLLYGMRMEAKGLLRNGTESGNGSRAAS